MINLYPHHTRPISPKSQVFVFGTRNNPNMERNPLITLGNWASLGSDLAKRIRASIRSASFWLMFGFSDTSIFGGVLASEEIVCFLPDRHTHLKLISSHQPSCGFHPFVVIFNS
ncbi:hypothetical protein RRG08_010070 [Elysia crispata]|uniref:Uncharacterized protein n=1 Tax=Elysia crispata TaxID=231223 RepID=A0AAE1B8Z7_9GAST|nr:hypothetical protein RRG08_010070 [Elysia crispata]